jgi:hypothetical protein
VTSILKNIFNQHSHTLCWTFTLRRCLRITLQQVSRQYIWHPYSSIRIRIVAGCGLPDLITLPQDVEILGLVRYHGSVWHILINIRVDRTLWICGAKCEYVPSAVCVLMHASNMSLCGCLLLILNSPGIYWLGLCICWRFGWFCLCVHRVLDLLSALHAVRSSQFLLSQH